MNNAICWICRSSNSKLLLNFIDYYEMYKYCINPNYKGNQYKLLCAQCARNIQQFDNFKKKCLESEKNFKDTIEAVVPKIKIEDVVYVQPSMVETVPTSELKSEPDLSAHNEEWLDDDDDDNDNDDLPEPPTSKYKFEGMCSLCNELFHRKHQLTKHMKYCGQPEPEPEEKKPKIQIKPTESLFCGICDTTCATEEAVSDHIKGHYEANELKCRLCDFEGMDFGHMLSHRFEHQPTSEYTRPKYTCFICGRYTTRLLKLEFHFRLAHLGLNGGRCLHCSRTFRVYRQYRVHRRFVATGGIPCDVCGRRFPNNYLLKQHKNVHGEKTLMCNVCGDRFVREFSLRGHLATHEPQPVRCSHCNKIFKSPFRLKKHLERELGDKKYKCTVCNKGYVRECDLKLHMIWHTDAKPHECDSCGKAYKAKSQLKMHIMVHHLNYLPHKCGECGKEFATNRRLKSHGSVHTGVRPFACPKTGCDRTFYSKNVVNEHVRKRHPAED